MPRKPVKFASNWVIADFLGGKTRLFFDETDVMGNVIAANRTSTSLVYETPTLVETQNSFYLLCGKSSMREEVQRATLTPEQLAVAYGKPIFTPEEQRQQDKVAALVMGYGNGAPDKAYWETLRKLEYDTKQAWDILNVVREYGLLCGKSMDRRIDAAQRFIEAGRAAEKLEEIGRLLGAVSLPDAPAQGEQG
jgi:hypothetical protein